MSLSSWSRSAGRYLRDLSALRRRRPRIVYLDYRWRHHGQHSGYLIVPAADDVLSRDNRIIPHPIVRMRARQTGDSDWERRLMLWLMLRSADAGLLHIVDGDFDVWAQRPRPSWLRTRVTATFHQPADKLAEMQPATQGRRLDGAFCVSRDQLPFIEPLVPNGRCWFLPHGIDTEFFQPPATAEASKSPPSILTVGVHRRDFSVLYEVAKMLHQRNVEARITLIAPVAARKRLPDDADRYISILSNVTDSALRAAYQSASVVFLPLEACTANNSLLEGMACGAAVVVTDLPGVRDYADEDSVVLCEPGSAEDHCNQIIRIIGDGGGRRRLGRKARLQAQQFSWDKVRQTAARIFEQIIEG